MTDPTPEMLERARAAGAYLDLSESQEEYLRGLLTMVCEEFFCELEHSDPSKKAHTLEHGLVCLPCFQAGRQRDREEGRRAGLEEAALALEDYAECRDHSYSWCACAMGASSAIRALAVASEKEK